MGQIEGDVLEGAANGASKWLEFGFGDFRDDSMVSFVLVTLRT